MEVIAMPDKFYQSQKVESTSYEDVQKLGGANFRVRMKSHNVGNVYEQSVAYLHLLEDSKIDSSFVDDLMAS